MLTKEQIKTCWNAVFSNSCASVTDGHFGGGLYAKFYLAKDKLEFPNGISENDPLGYFARVDGEEYKEINLGLSIAPPVGSYLAYGNAKMRKVTIKNITEDKLIARFKAIHSFVMENADKLHKVQFDIATK